MNTWSHHREIIFAISNGFLAIAFMVLVFILSRRMWLMSDQQIRLKHSNLFVKLIIRLIHETLSGGISMSSNAHKTLRFFARGRYPRKIMVEVLADFASKFKGRYHQAIVELYELLGLSRDSARKLNSNDRLLVIQGIRELNLFGLTVPDPIMMKILDHRDPDIREEAVVMLFHLHKNPFELLEHGRSKITLWQQSILLGNLSRLSQDQVPDLSSALASTHTDIKNFAIRTIGVLELKSYVFRLMRMLRQEKPAMKLAIVRTLAKLNGKGYEKLFGELTTDPDPAVRATARNIIAQRNRNSKSPKPLEHAVQ